MIALIYFVAQLAFGNGDCLPTPSVGYITNNVNSVVYDQNIGYAAARINDNLTFRVNGTNQMGFTNTSGSSVLTVVLSSDGCGHWIEFPGGGTTNFNGFVAGSLANHLLTNIVTRTNPAASLTPFTGSARNPAFWLNGVSGLTGIMFTNTINDSPRFAISPWHVAGNCHNFSSTGFGFMQADNTIVVRSLLGSQIIPGSSDLCCGVLDAALPAGIQPLPITPANLTSYITATLYGGNFQKRFPAIVAGSDGNIGVKDINFLDCLGCESPYSSFYTDLFSTSVYVDSDFVVLNPNSGRAVMLLVNNQLVLNMSLHNGNLAGPSYGKYLPELQSAMDSLMTTHHPLETKPTIQVYDLTSFPTYP